MGAAASPFVVRMRIFPGFGDQHVSVRQERQRPRVIETMRDHRGIHRSACVTIAGARVCPANAGFWPLPTGSRVRAVAQATRLGIRAGGRRG